MKKKRIEVNFDKDTMKKLEAYARKRKISVSKAGSRVLERAIKAELGKSKKDTHDWQFSTTPYDMQRCRKCGIFKKTAYRNGELKCKGIKTQIEEDGRLRVTYNYQEPDQDRIIKQMKNSTEVTMKIPPFIVHAEATLRWWGKIRAWLRGLPCKQCKGEWNISCKGKVCKLKPLQVIPNPVNKQIMLRGLLPRRKIEDMNWIKSLEMRSPPLLPDKPIRRKSK